MRVFKTKSFTRDAKKFGVSEAALLAAVDREALDADLGGGVVKQRIAREGQGKSGGFRSIILLKPGKSAFFVFVFAKTHATISRRRNWRHSSNLLRRCSTLMRLL